MPCYGEVDSAKTNYVKPALIRFDLKSMPFYREVDSAKTNYVKPALIRFDLKSMPCYEGSRFSKD